MSTRVLATNSALNASRQMARMLDGDLQSQLQAVKDAGRMLSDPGIWDGPAALQFRTQQWPPAGRSVDGVLQALRTLQQSSQKVVEDIVRAGSEGKLAAPAGPGPQPSPGSSAADQAAVTSLSKDAVQRASSLYALAYKAQNDYDFSAIGGYLHDMRDLEAAKASYRDYSSKAIPELQHVIDTTDDPALKVKAQNLLSIIEAQQKLLSSVDPKGLMNQPDPNVLHRVSAQAGVLTALGAVVTTSITKGGTVTAEFGQKGGVTIFYRGTTLGSAMEVTQDQALDVDRILANQSQYSGIAQSGVYITSQRNTADYYADLAGGGGRGLGPGVIRIELPPDEFDAFVARTGIQVEAPVPNPPVPGQTETVIPFDNVEEFDAMAMYFLEEEE